MSITFQKLLIMGQKSVTFKDLMSHLHVNFLLNHLIENPILSERDKNTPLL
jgi:hypothetical protein